MKIEKLLVNDRIKNHNSNPLPSSSSLAICASLFVFSVSFIPSFNVLSVYFYVY